MRKCKTEIPTNYFQYFKSLFNSIHFGVWDSEAYASDLPPAFPGGSRLLSGCTRAACRRLPQNVCTHLVNLLVPEDWQHYITIRNHHDGTMERLWKKTEACFLTVNQGSTFSCCAGLCELPSLFLSLLLLTIL